jgi:ABC-type glycerol-3-phosphate transport system permease component
MSSYMGRKINPQRFDRSQIRSYLILIPVSIIMVLPIIYVVVTAFKPLNELFAYPPKFFVRNPSLQNFRDLWRVSQSMGIPFSRYLINSIVSTALVVVLSIALSLTTGYALSKKDFRGRNVIATINTVSLMFVPTAVGIPRYLIISGVGLTNTFWVHIFPMLAMPVGLFLVKQFIDTVPDSLIESARIDGAGDFLIVHKIIAPIVKPALATVGLLAFQSSWNAIEASTIYITNDALKTLPFYLSVLTSQQNLVAGAGLSAAATLIQLLPNMIIFIILQSRVMNTMAHSGIK